MRSTTTLTFRHEERTSQAVRPSVRLIPLGGLGEIGMNCMAVETDDSIVVVDCGVMFPEKELGIDVIHPDFSYLLENHRKVRGIVITHGHEDHVGAVPYLLRELNVPVHGPQYALSLIEERLREVDGVHDPIFNPSRPRDRIKLGSIEIEPIRVTHSIADATALAIRTPAGLIVHTGDFKFDPNPGDRETLDEEHFAELADEGVRALLSDSTNSEVEGTSGSETDVAHELHGLIAQARGRVIVSMFASNTHRFSALADIAQKTGRVVALFGRSMQTHSRIAIDGGYMKDPSGILISADHAAGIPREKLMIFATGSQGEPVAALSRIAQGIHPQLRLERGDTVILSSRVIPGNEREVAHILNDLARAGIEIHAVDTNHNVHVTGHAYAGEQRRMIELVRPDTFLPVHGGYRQLAKHGALASELGVSDVVVAENGSVLELDRDGLRKVGETQSGRIAVEMGVDLPKIVLDDRENLAKHGVAIAVLVLDKKGRIRSRPEIFTRGVIDEDAHPEIIIRAAEFVEDALLAHPSYRDSPDEEELEEVARRALRRFFRRFKRNPAAYTVIHWLP